MAINGVFFAQVVKEMYMKKSKLLMLMASVALCCSAFLGTAWASPAVLDDNSPGSFLVFPRFDIRGDTITELRIVNNGENLTNSNGDVVDLKVKLNYVCPGVKHVNEFCAALDRTITFTPNQTRIIDVADQNPPCSQGYVIAYAVSPIGIDKPAAYDYLTGSYYITSARSNEADGAIAIQAVGLQGPPNGASSAVQLSFGTDYRALGTVSYTDFRAASTEPEAGSVLTLMTLDVLAGMQNPAAVVFIDFWNSAEVPFSTSHEFICWTEKQIETIDLNFLEANLGTTYGSMRITPNANCPLPGGCPPLVPYDATILGAISEYGCDSKSHTLFHDQDPKTTTYQPR